jgi:peptide/nickel transport system permease protein
MRDLVLRRLAVALPTLLLVSVFVFFLQKLLPGDPVLVIAGEERDPEVLAYLRELYRFDDPLPMQYLAWLGQVVQGNFGVSLRTDLPVAQLILQKLPVTLQLAAFSIVIALGIGIPAGVVAAIRKGTAADHAASVVALSGLSLPNFWLGLMLILVVSVQFNLLPSSGFVSLFDDPVEALRTTAMPAFVLGTGLAAYIMRHTRSSMLEVMSSDYIRTARAKGLLEDRVVWKHAFRNALIPIVTTTTLLFGELMGGAVLTEQIFGIPGFGKLVVDGVFNRDYAVVQGIVLVVAVAFILMNLLADILYIVINPRLRGAA